jgi:hypothetical protein
MPGRPLTVIQIRHPPAGAKRRQVGMGFGVVTEPLPV